MAGQSNMTTEEVKLYLRKLYNDLFGPGYFDGNTESIYIYSWFFGSPAEVYRDIMANHGGDEALRARPGFGTWH